MIPSIETALVGRSLTLRFDGPRSAQSAHFLLLYYLFALLLCPQAASETRISGNYVAHGDSFAESLQLTETGDGKVNGVLGAVKLNAQGHLDSSEHSVSGTIDNGQITLAIRNGFAGLGDTSMSGAVQGNCITLQHFSEAGVESTAFCRASPIEFKRYVDSMTARANAIVTNSALEKCVRSADETGRQSESWIADAQLHVDRIAAVEDGYQKIESKMLQLLQRQQTTQNTLERSQISVAIIQVNLMGIKLDVESNKVWTKVTNDATSIDEQFKDLVSVCATSESKVHERGASQSLVERWRVACQATFSGRNQFDTVFREVLKRRSELEAYKINAQRRRQAIVDESGRPH